MCIKFVFTLRVVISLGDVNHIDDDALSNKSDISDLTIDEPLVDSQTTLTNHSTGDRAQAANHVALGRGVSEAGSSVRELKTLVFKEVKRPGKSKHFNFNTRFPIDDNRSRISGCF